MFFHNNGIDMSVWTKSTYKTDKSDIFIIHKNLMRRFIPLQKKVVTIKKRFGHILTFLNNGEFLSVKPGWSDMLTRVVRCANPGGRIC